MCLDSDLRISVGFSGLNKHRENKSIESSRERLNTSWVQSIWQFRPRRGLCAFSAPNAFDNYGVRHISFYTQGFLPQGAASKQLTFYSYSL
ncbi:hypothetical protein Hanom_Chr16g01447441 [Helianthus anomalus]